MPRTRRLTAGAYVYHVLNRSAKKGLLFRDASDYRTFEDLLGDATKRVPMRILAYCLMPNHWHLLLWPLRDGDLSRYVKWLTTTHACRWVRDHGCIGDGAVYQSRFKSIPIQKGPHLFWTWRYVERNALRAGLVSRAEDWEWCSLRRRAHNLSPDWLAQGPFSLPPDWTAIVNVPQTNAELELFRNRMKKGKPFGPDQWLASDRPDLRITKKEGQTPT